MASYDMYYHSPVPVTDFSASTSLENHLHQDRWVEGRGAFRSVPYALEHQGSAATLSVAQSERSRSNGGPAIERG